MTEPEASSETVALAQVNTHVCRLEKRVARGEGQRKWIWVAWAFTTLAVIALLVLYIQLIVTRGNSRAYYNQQNAIQNQRIHALVCLSVSLLPDDVSPVVPQLRTVYHCPPFNASRQP